MAELSSKVQHLQQELSAVQDAAAEVKAQRDQIMAWQAGAREAGGDKEEVKRMVAEASNEAKQAVEGLRGEIKEFKQSFHRELCFKIMAAKAGAEAGAGVCLVPLCCCGSTCME